MMGKRIGKYLALAAMAILTGVIAAQSTSQAESGATPGSADDPIVTKSYVDQKVAELVRQELAKVGGSGGTALEVVTVPSGKRLIVTGGSEVIVRSGKAVAYSPDSNGLSDLTDGKDIAPGKPVPANHLILFPRDGRGIEADPASANGLIVLVRGTYHIE